MYKYLSMLLLVFFGAGCASVPTSAQQQDVALSVPTSPHNVEGGLVFKRSVKDDSVGHIEADVPVVVGLKDATFEANLNWYLEASLEVDINNWHRMPDVWLDEKNSFQRRCLPITMNQDEILFQCMTQTWHGNMSDGPTTTVYGLSLPDGEWMSTPVAEKRASGLGWRDRILTENDFTGFGLSSSTDQGSLNASEETFHIQIQPGIPAYTFHVVAYSSSTGSAGSIQIFTGSSTGTPLQVIPLDPNAFLADEVPLFFNARDIDFDGFLDIGVVADGGATWGSYQYWVFDPKTGLFTTSPAAEDFRQIDFNGITFDSKDRQLVTRNLDGESDLYQFRNGHWFIAEKEDQENHVQDAIGQSSSTLPILHCSMTTTVYSGKRTKVTHQVFNQECNDQLYTF